MNRGEGEREGRRGGGAEPIDQSSMFASGSFHLYPEDTVQTLGSKVT